MNKLLSFTLLLTPALMQAQAGLDPADTLKPLKDQWTSYSGDLTGKRFSALKLVNTNTVKNLSLKWAASNIATGCGPTGVDTSGGGGGFGGGRGRGGGGPAAPIVVGGLGNGDANNCGPARLGGGILFVDGIIYASSPDNVWAIDARDGTVLWHYYWKTRGGTSLQTRGLGMWHSYIYFELHDDWVVCLDAKNGREVWKKEISSFDQQYFSSNAPMVLGNHVIVGTGNDMDAPGFIKAFNPETGELQWTLYSTPTEPRRPRNRNLGQPRRRPPRRRHDLDSRLLRSRHPSLHLRHRQPHARLHHRPRRRRQSLHLRPDRGQRRYRQDGLVLPDFAARHP